MTRRTAQVVAGLGMLFLAAPPLPAQDKPRKVIMLGDSITRGVRTGVKAEETFANLVQADLAKKKFPVEIINVGIGGETTEMALARLEKAVIVLKPIVVMIMYGTNDSFIDKGKTESRLGEKQYADNLRKLVENLRKADIDPVLMTPPPFGDKHPVDGAGKHPNERLEAYVKICRQVAKETNTPLVDNFARWTKAKSKGADISAWMTDECHPNPRGHEEIAEALVPAIMRAVREYIFLRAR